LGQVSSVDLAVIVVYVLGIVGVGCWFVRRATWQGALAGVVYSAGALAIAKFCSLRDITCGLSNSDLTLHVFTYPILGIGTCVVFGAATSLLFTPRPEADTALFTWAGIRRAAKEPPKAPDAGA